MQELLSEIRKCDHCKVHLPHGPRPVVAADRNSRIAVIGQAPGLKVHLSGIPWDDASGRTLRDWMGLSPEEFYDQKLLALIPMGFCYPGKGKSGDLPPRPECAPLWHSDLIAKMPQLKLTLLIGTYSQKYYLGDLRKDSLTETVTNYQTYLPNYFPLPHPSPRNRFWLSKNPWFESEILPELKKRIQRSIK